MIKRSFVPSGRWRVVKSLSFEGCCDCGLVHRVEFRTRKGKVERRIYRDDELTKQARKQFKHQFRQSRKAT